MPQPEIFVGLDRRPHVGGKSAWEAPRRYQFDVPLHEWRMSKTEILLKQLLVDNNLKGHSSQIGSNGFTKHILLIWEKCPRDVECCLWRSGLKLKRGEIARNGER